MFVPVGEARAVVDRLGGIGVDGDVSLDSVERDGQVRLWWDRNPVDLFFSYDPFHDAAKVGIRMVPFADTSIPILAADHLTVMKVIFDRPKDWVDIDAMIASGAPIDSDEVLRWVGRIAGPGDPRFVRIARVLAAWCPNRSADRPSW